ncbi:MAG TPA: hypothetical protein V6C64_14730 [Microcoleaceae cyanobacterium]|jgi:hypothetical protein
MAYEFAQHVLDQLATATEIFAAGYVGINFVIYSWKRTESESSLTQPTVIPETTAITEAPLEVLQPLPLSLPKRELVEISATTNTEAEPIRQLVDLNEGGRSTEPLPSVNLAPPLADRMDDVLDDIADVEADVEIDEPATVTPTPAPEPTPIAAAAEANTTELEQLAQPEVTVTSPVVAEPPTKPEATAASPTIAEPSTETKPVLKRPPVRPVTLGQSSTAPATPQPAQPTDKLTEED